MCRRRVMKCVALTIVGIFTLAGVASAADAPGGPNATNPFALSSEVVNAIPSPNFEDEDESSPFLLVHRNEETRYGAIYLAHYRAGGNLAPAAIYRRLPSSVDAQGRPLWFDRGYGDNFLNYVVAILLQNEQFLDLERLFDDWSDPSARRADGRPMLTAYASALETAVAYTLEWDKIREVIQSWRAKNPYSPAAAITEAIYWKNYAWNARGSGYASSVTPDGWNLFNERLEKAMAVLEESRLFASDNPLWSVTYIDVGNGLNWPKARLMRQFAKSIAKNPTFSSLYTTTGFNLTPQWGGSWSLVDEFARNAVKASEAAEGKSFYARVYMSVDSCNCDQFDLFRDSQANWPDMKRGLEDLVRLYPHSAWNLNKFAAYACVASDKETFLSLRFKLGKLIMPTAWPANHSLDLCDHKFGPAPS
jgi:hypothetical protein